MAPKVCQENTPYHRYTTSRGPETLIWGRTDPCFHVVYAKFSPENPNVAAEIQTCQTRCLYFQSSVVQFWIFIFAFLLSDDRRGSRFGLLVGPVVHSEMLFCLPGWWTVVASVTVAFLSSGASLPFLLWPLTSTRLLHPFTAVAHLSDAGLNSSKLSWPHLHV